MDKIVFPFYYRTFAKIDLQAIIENFDALKARTNPETLSCSVVKADGYGHGSVRVAKVLEERTDYFAVAALEEAIVLREAGIKKPILILGYTHPSQFELLFDYDIIPVIYHVDDAEKLSDIAVKRGNKKKIHTAVDTGMGRIGFRPDEEGAEEVKKIFELEGIELEGIFSHYAKADYTDKTSANLQTEKFDHFLALLSERGVEIPIKHICNSAGTIEFERHYNMARYGISLYGMYPSDEVDKSRVKLKPAMSVFSHVVHVKWIEPGDGVGYGQIYVADEKRKIATVAVGYADGYNRCMTGKGWVLINGKKAPIRGKICMDQIMVDVTDIYDVEVGDIAVLVGRYGDEEISAELFGELTHSFDYEVVCTFMPRVKRFYYFGDEPAGGLDTSF